MEDARSKSFWLEGSLADYTPNPHLEGDKEYDFVIIGGGFTGISTAYFMKEREPGMRIAILESRVAGFGASGRNDGFNMTLLGENIIQLTKWVGPEKARDAHQWALEAVDTVKGLVEKHGIDCDYEHTGFLQIGVSDPHIAKMKKEVELHRQYGTDATLLTAEETRELLPSTPVSAGMLDPHCGVLNPAKYTLGMKSVVEDQGVDFYENSKVTDIKEGKIIKVHTANGSISAPHAMLATNAYSTKLGYFRSRIFPLFTYIVLTEPLNDGQMKDIGWEGRWGIETPKRFVHYFRLTVDNRISIGGGDGFYYFNHGVEQDQHPGTFRQLEEDVVWLFPPLKGIKFTHRWGGPVGCTFDYFPMAGVTGKYDNLFYSLAYMGHGVSLANASGKIIRDLYFGEDTHRTRLFFINRRPFPCPPEPLLYPSIAAYKGCLRILDGMDDRRTKQVIRD